MSKIAVTSDRAPAAIGPYSQAIRAGSLLFCSGQIGIHPDTGAMVAGGVEEQTRQVLRNMTAVLEAAGATLDDVVKTAIFLVDLDDFQKVNAIYAEHFSGTPPARATVEVSRLPAGALVEIEAIAQLEKDG